MGRSLRILAGRLRKRYDRGQHAPGEKRYMDDQTQRPSSDPSASQTWIRRPTPPASPARPPEWVQQNAALPPSPAEATRQAKVSPPLPGPNRPVSPSMPQPILFSNVE